MNSDGTWSAGRVTVNPAGTASLNVQAYPSGSDPNSTPPDGQQQSDQPQPAILMSAAFSQVDTWAGSGGPSDSGSYVQTWNWDYQSGGWAQNGGSGWLLYPTVKGSVLGIDIELEVA